MGFLLYSFNLLSTGTLEGPVTLFGDQNAKCSTGVLVGKCVKVLLCDPYFSDFEGYFRLSSRVSLRHLDMNSLQLPMVRNALERSGSCLSPKLVNLGWQCSILETGELDTSLSPKSRRKCPVHKSSGLQLQGFPFPVSHLLWFGLQLCAFLLGR